MARSLLEAVARRWVPYLQGDQLTALLATVQSWRGTIEDVEGAALHLWALPSRADLRRLQRRVVGLRRRVSELDRAVARLERCLAEPPQD